MPTAMELRPDQFQVNEAWIVFQLNEAPIDTEQDGSFNCICLMDAASCFLLSSELIPSTDVEPSKRQARQLLTAGWANKGEFPQQLFVPTGRYPRIMAAEAALLGMAVISVPEDDLLVFIGDAREGYREHMLNRAAR